MRNHISPIAAVAFLTTLTPAVSNSVTPAENYLETRDRFVSEAKAIDEPFEAKYSELQRSLGTGAAEAYRKGSGGILDAYYAGGARMNELQGLLEQMIGPFSVPGFQDKGAINLTTLVPELGFGMLDGMNYSSIDRKTTVLVTTRSLFDRWTSALTECKSETPRSGYKVVEKECFYTAAIGSFMDKRAAGLGAVPVVWRSGTDYASAMLAIWTADSIIGLPDRILASVVRGDKVYVLSQLLGVKLKPEKVCESAWHKHADNFQHYAGDVDIEYQKCFVEHVVKQRKFLAAINQAQRMVDLVGLNGDTPN